MSEDAVGQFYQEQGVKRCSLCGQVKPHADFYRNRSCYSSQCRPCNSSYKHWRYQLDSEGHRTAMQRYRERLRERARTTGQ